MPDVASTREEVHRLAEACSEEGDAFQPTAMRLVREQRRLSKFFEANFETLGAMSGQVALYMLTVSMRVFEQLGGRLTKVSGKDIDAASAKVQAVMDELLPADEGFAERVKAVAWRAQPHLLDEVLWALYERDDAKAEGRAEPEADGEDAAEDGEETPAGPVDLDADQSAMVYMMLWVAIEALDANWRPPSTWGPDDPRADVG